MRSMFNGADDPAQGPPPRPAGSARQDVRASKARPRITRSRIAKPLLTSLGTATMLAASSFVVLAVSSTGSVRPWDWTRMDPSAAIIRYRLCAQQGPGAIGCMLGAGFRQASAAPASREHTVQQPLFSVVTVHDPAPSETPGPVHATRAPSPPASTSSTRAGASSPKAGGSQHLATPLPTASAEPGDD